MNGGARASLGDPLELPCGAVLKNRVAKAAMSDSLGDGRGDATAAQARLYARWADGGAGLSIVGEVQVDARYPEKPGNLVVDAASDAAALGALAEAGSRAGCALWAQLGHAGALADPELVTGRGPSALEVGDFRCEALSEEELAALPERFARAAAILKKFGFGGVEIHAGHGFLLSQFLSPLFNRRTDGYGGDVPARARLLLEVIEAVRRAVGPHFPIGVKLNASDGLEGGLSEDDALVVVERLDATSVDLIDISGGTYFPGARSASDTDGGGAGPYFVAFARRARRRTAIPLMVTGGFRREAEAVAALASGDVDVVGLGRALAIDPDLPARWLEGAARGDGAGASDPVFPRFESPPPGGITAWYTMRLTALAESREAEMSGDPAAATLAYERRDAARRDRWRARRPRVEPPHPGAGVAPPRAGEHS